VPAHAIDPPGRSNLYRVLSNSTYPLHQAFGSLELAILADGEGLEHRHRAEAVDGWLGQALILLRCQLLAEARANAADELSFATQVSYTFGYGHMAVLCQVMSRCATHLQSASC
jgi:hypothetical protein